MIDNKLTTKEIITGHAAMLAANTIWGLMSPIGKEALNSPDIQPLTLAGMRIIGAALLFWAGSLFLPKSIAPKEDIDRKDIVPIIFASLLITFANQMCVIYGMSMTSPIDATIMCSTTPFFTLLLMWLLMHDRPHWAKVVGVLMGFGGMLVFILSGKTDAAMHVDNPLLGNIICAASQFFGAIYMVKYAFLTRKYSPFTLMKWLFTVSAIIMLFVSGPSIVSTPWAGIDTKVLLEAGYVVVFGTFLAYVFLPMGQRVMKPTMIAMYNYLQPIVSAAFSIAVGLATITLPTVIGTALIFTGVWIVNKK